MDTVGGFAAFLALGVIGLAMLLGPVGGALARWIESKSGRQPDDLADLQQQQLEQLAGRVNELEERLDFAERMLAAKRDAQLDRGGA
jgi:hypothetical protein